MKIIVYMTDGVELTTTPDRMAEQSGGVFQASDRVPGAAGEGFDLGRWYAALAAGKTESVDAAIPAPTHLAVKAADEFEAVIPWNQMAGAFFLYSLDGAPLSKGGPLRLYVPDGTSACLNVKSVNYVRFVSDPGMGNEASYGFRNEISPDRLSQGLKARVSE